MNKTQKGFAVLESLLILVIIAIIGGIGWYAVHTKHQTDKILSQADKISQTTPVNKTPSSTPAAKSPSSDAELIATAIADKCLESYPNINKTNLEKILLDNFSGSDSTLVLHGNYARAGSTCDDTNNGQGGGFGSWLMKENSNWKVAFNGQQPPDCSSVDGQGWPSDILSQCYDKSINDYRAPK